MRIIKNGRVYDLGYDAYDRVCSLPTQTVSNGVGVWNDIRVALCRDRKDGKFFVLREIEGDSVSTYHRQSKEIIPQTPEQACKIAEGFLDYDNYVRFFGDPEGGDSALERKAADAVKAKESAETMRDFWYKDSSEKAERIKELETELSKLRDAGERK